MHSDRRVGESDHSPLEFDVRTVQDKRGITWICLELPEVPAEHREAASTMATDIVAIECNSGAERVIALVPSGWDDDMDDARLSDMILSRMG